MEFTRKDKLRIPLAVLKDNSMQPLQMFLRSDLESKERRRKQKGPSNAMGRGTPQIIFILPNSPDGRWDRCPKHYRGAKLRTAQHPETVQDYRRPPVRWQREEAPQYWSTSLEVSHEQSKIMEEVTLPLRCFLRRKNIQKTTEPEKRMRKRKRETRRSFRWSGGALGEKRFISNVSASKKLEADGQEEVKDFNVERMRWISIWDDIQIEKIKEETTGKMRF